MAIASNDEIIIGMVGPLGTPMTEIEENVISFFKKRNYRCTYIKVAHILSKLEKTSASLSGAHRIQYLQNLGDALRTKLKCPEILAIGVIATIARKRTGQVDKHVIIVRSFKHPEEIHLLRKIYGSRFFLIGVSALLSMRKQHLQRKCQEDLEQNLSYLIENDRTGTSRYDYMWDSFGIKCLETHCSDDEETHKFTQRIEETFCLADLFINVSYKEEAQWLLKRFLECILGYPFHTPTMEEFGMSLARTVSLRSSAISRQVGAVIMDTKGNLLAEGCNETPKSGGGCYWATQELDLHPENDSRDFRFLHGHAAEQLTKECCTDIADSVQKICLSSQKSSEKKKAALVQELEQSRLVRMKLFEHRTVHAEMGALTNAAYKGISVKETTMYVTTFPCHECTKHIISSGLKKIIYLEPYPKSEALRFWPQEVIDLEQSLDPLAHCDRVIFRSFRGISPSCYHLLFSPQTRKRYNKALPIHEEEEDFHQEIVWKTPSKNYLHSINEQIFLSGLPKQVQIFLEEMKKSDL